MGVHLTIIKDELESIKSEYIEMIPDVASTRGIRIWSPEELQGDPRYLYIAEHEEDLEKAPSVPDNIVFISSKTKNELGRTIYANMLVIREKIDINTLFSLIARICEEYSAWESDLCEAVMEEKSLEDFMEIASAPLKNTIGIYDAAQALLYHSPIDSSLIGNSIWKDTLDKKYPKINFFSQDEIRMINERFNMDTKPILINPKRDSTHTYLLSPIRVEGRQVGSIGMTDLASPITAGQLDICDRITQLLSHVFRSYMRKNSNKNDVYYLLQLISNQNIDKRNVECHLDSMGWKFNDAYYMASFQLSEGFTISQEGHTFHIRIHELYPKALLFYYNNLIIAIIRKNDTDLREEAGQKHLEKFCKQNMMYCAVSNLFHDFMKLHTYYIQCSVLLNVHRKDQLDKHVLYFTDNYTDYLLNALSDARDLDTFCNPGILELANSNRKNKNEIMESIYTYLITGRSIANTARELYIHRNTLTYRLTTAEEILGVKLDALDNNEVLQMLISCIIINKIY